MMRPLSVLRPQFAIGSHVRLRGSRLCGSVRSVLRFPRAIAYGVSIIAMMRSCPPAGRRPMAPSPKQNWSS